MTDWIYESTQAQAELENARTELYVLMKKLQLYEYALQLILDAKLEVEPSKVLFQRNHFINIVKGIFSDGTKS